MAIGSRAHISGVWKKEFEGYILSYTRFEQDFNKFIQLNGVLKPVEVGSEDLLNINQMC